MGMKHFFCLLFLSGVLCGCMTRRELALEEKIGQLLVVGFRGGSVEETDSVVRDIRRYHLGGVILFDEDVALGGVRRNICSPEQLARLTSTLQSYAEVPLLIAIDQEGGRVNRLNPSLGFPETFSHQALGARDELEATYRESQRLAAALRAAGINLNLAPVVDLAVSPNNFIVKKERTFSGDPERVAFHAAQFIRAHHALGVFCALKHFPGHGSSALDSHFGMTDVTETWSPQELVPYRRLCGEADVVMTAHVFQRSLDPIWPATLSRKMITGVLREQIGFQGVVISDDLGMKAVADHYGFETVLERALNAGVDLLLIANNLEYDPDVVPITVQTLVRLVESVRVSEARIDEAFDRVQTLKRQL